MKSKNGNLIIMKIIFIITLTVIIIFGLLSVINRFNYGTFNVLAYPKWIKVDPDIYYNDDNFKIEKINYPMYEVSRAVEKICGKSIYSDEANFKDRGGCYIYLHVKGNMYIIYCRDSTA